MQRFRYLLLILPLVFLSGCTGGGIDLVALTKNPIIMAIIIIIALWVAFKMKK